jgi:Gram-negative bacterial TonB protein C-terminal
MRLSIVAVLLVLSLPAQATSQEKSEGTISNSAKGFDGQYREFLDAYHSGDSRRVELSLAGFELPPHWFNDTFGADQGQELAAQYVTQFKEFEFSTALRLGRCGGSSAADSRTRLQSSVEVNFPAELTGNLPPALRFMITYGRCTWMDGYTYVDGRFRYYGRGISSFWDPVLVRAADPCGPNDGTQPNGRLIHRVEPVYPDEASQKHIKGVVLMVVIVAKDGSVKGVRNMKGNPLLVDAAREAVMQWRYTPFMNCGEPVEMGSAEQIKFPSK